tara:strand:+ start:451 stop:597 length:147 start_codon:yes stop_codon:yes gene_type:complete
MKITKQRLIEIIKEEMEKLANPIDEKLTQKEKERKSELEDELKDLEHK